MPYDHSPHPLDSSIKLAQTAALLRQIKADIQQDILKGYFDRALIKITQTLSMLQTMPETILPVNICSELAVLQNQVKTNKICLAHIKTADQCIAQGNYSKALDHAKNALDLDPENQDIQTKHQLIQNNLKLMQEMSQQPKRNPPSGLPPATQLSVVGKSLLPSLGSTKTTQSIPTTNTPLHHRRGSIFYGYKGEDTSKTQPKKQEAKLPPIRKVLQNATFKP